MKHSSEYLFGRNRDAYEPCLTVLASRRLVDAKILLKQLSKERDTTDDIEALIQRYQDVERAIEHWTDILEEK